MLYYRNLLLQYVSYSKILMLWNNLWSINIFRAESYTLHIEIKYDEMENSVYVYGD